MTAASALRDQLKQLLPEDSVPTITDLVIRAVVLALREHPALNASLEDGGLTPHESVHVGVAIDTDDGLIVPVLHDAGSVPLRELGARTRELARRARANELGPDDVQGGTFTVTSLGTLGIDFFTPIVNPPQVAMLGIGRTFTRVVLEERNTGRATVDVRQPLVRPPGGGRRPRGTVPPVSQAPAGASGRPVV